MEFIDFKITDNDEDRRFDSFLRKLLPQMPLSLIYKNIRTGFIRLNNKKVKQEIKIKKDDLVNIEKHLLDRFYTQEKSTETDKNYTEKVEFIEKLINFKNDNILILNKPYNVNVQDSKNDKNSLASIIKSIYDKKSLTFVPGPMHRLDKFTTGLLCFSQNLSCARWFSQQIASHSIKKYYLAILEGKLDSEVEWIDFLSKNDENSNIHISRISDKTEGKKSITVVKPILHGKFNGIDITFAKIYIQTGRNHQIRLQCSKHGFPILQDDFYNSRIATMKTDFEQKLYLHCYKLEFPQNEFEIPKCVFSSLPVCFDNALKKCLIETSFQDYNI